MRNINLLLYLFAACTAIVAFGFTSVSSKHESAPFFGDFVDLDTVRMHLTDCSAQGKVCVPIPLGQALQLNITDNGVPIPVNFMNGCDFDTTRAYTYATLHGGGNAGPYAVTSWPVNGVVFSGNFNTIPQLVDSMNTWDAGGNWVHDAVHSLITGGNSANSYDTMKIWVQQIASPSFLGFNIGVTPKGTEMSFGKGFHTIIMENVATTESDTFYVHATCSETVNMMIPAGESRNACLSTSDLVGLPQSASWCNQAPTTTIADVSINTSTFCLDIAAFSSGMVSTCVVLCDESGFCDTTFFNITVFEEGVPTVIEYDVYVGDGVWYCFDTTGVSSPSLASCGTTNLGYADYEIANNSYCVQFTGLEPSGTDTICINICNELGECDEFRFLIHVLAPIGQVFTFPIQMEEGADYTYCFDGASNPPHTLSLCESTENGFATGVFDETTLCGTFTGLEAGGTDTICAIVCNSFGTCDTTYFHVTVTERTSGTATVIPVTVFEEFELTYCIDTVGTGEPLTFSVCGATNNGFAELNFDFASLCGTFTGITAGASDTLCLLSCNTAGICDTTYFVVTAIAEPHGPLWVFDTLLQNFIGNYCVDTSQFAGNLDTLVANLPATLSTNPTVNTNLESYCIGYSGALAGTDTLTIVLSNLDGEQDTTYLVLTVLAPTPSLIESAIDSGQIVEHCLDLSELSGNNYTVTNICPEKSGGYLTFALDTLSLCVEIEAIRSGGTDTACYVVCDQFGVCDTIIFHYSANGSGVPLPPLAFPDVTVTMQSTLVDISVLDNDTVNGVVQTLIVLPATSTIGPIGGQVSVDLVNGHIQYTPDAEFCGTTDNFMYLVCNEHGCDTALVTVMIVCENNPNDTLVFFDAFSPNGDGMNDKFEVENLHVAPNGQMTIFNRWGNIVYFQEKFTNDAAWDGRWNGKEVPDGVYFYLFNDGKNTSREGIVTLRR